ANPIDAFVAARLRDKGLKPVGPADRRTLLRRVHLDLVGIPPTPAEQAAFLEDRSPDAFEKVVDRLLASEQHGVRYARHWLDVLLAGPEELFAAGKAIGDAQRLRAELQAPIDELLAPYRKRLYDERVAMLPPDVQAVVLKPEKSRTPAEQKIADDYFPVLRID